MSKGKGGDDGKNNGSFDSFVEIDTDEKPSSSYQRLVDDFDENVTYRGQSNIYKILHNMSDEEYNVLHKIIINRQEEKSDKAGQHKQIPSMEVFRQNSAEVSNLRRIIEDGKQDLASKLDRILNPESNDTGRGR